MEPVNSPNLSGSAAATPAIALGVNLPSTAAVADDFSVTAQVFDSLGNAHDLDITFTKTAVNTWSWAASDPTLDGGATSSGSAVGSGDIVFDTDGTPLAFSPVRSEEHTSELQSLMRISYAVFCLKKKKKVQ